MVTSVRRTQGMAHWHWMKLPWVSGKWAKSATSRHDPTALAVFLKRREQTIFDAARAISLGPLNVLICRERERKRGE
jgi:hypothetical protein